jgi:hypothetical protein
MLRKGDLLFTKPKIKSRFLRARRKVLVEIPQNEEFGHVAIYIGNNQVIDSNITRGVKRVPLGKFLEHNEVKVYRVNGGDKEHAVKIAKSLEGKGYGLFKVIRSFILPRKKLNDPDKSEALARQIPKNFNKVFCSTVAVAAYPDIFKNISKHPFDIFPADIIKSPITTEVKNGIPKRYK